MKKKKDHATIIQEMAIAAMEEAVRDVIKRHKKTGRPLAIWENGKVVLISPYNIKQH